MIETVSHNGLDTEVYDLRPTDYTTTTTTTTTTNTTTTDGKVTWAEALESGTDSKAISAGYLLSTHVSSAASPGTRHLRLWTSASTR